MITLIQAAVTVYCLLATATAVRHIRNPRDKFDAWTSIVILITSFIAIYFVFDGAP